MQANTNTTKGSTTEVSNDMQANTNTTKGSTTGVSNDMQANTNKLTVLQLK